MKNLRRQVWGKVRAPILAKSVAQSSDKVWLVVWNRVWRRVVPDGIKRQLYVERIRDPSK